MHPACIHTCISASKYTSVSQKLFRLAVLSNCLGLQDVKEKLSKYAEPEIIRKEFDDILNQQEKIAALDFNNDSKYKGFLNEVK